MKQKVVTRAIIRQDDKILLLRRHGGRPSIEGLFELPGGRVDKHQQPEDSLVQSVLTHTGSSLGSAKLADVMTYIDPDDRELQYTFIVYEAGLKPTSRTITLSEEYDKYIWKSLSELQLEQLTESTKQLLKLTPSGPGAQTSMVFTEKDDDKKATYDTLVAYSDGGSRGNPGPSASGYVLMDERGQIVYEGGTYLGHTTNNVAEYTAVLEALTTAQLLGARTVDMRMDSQLVANQMNGIYKIKNPDLAVIHRKIQVLAAQFDRVSYTYVAREHNKLADGMVNKILDTRADDDNQLY